VGQASGGAQREAFEIILDLSFDGVAIFPSEPWPATRNFLLVIFF
jgi:hypothetical protein